MSKILALVLTLAVARTPLPALAEEQEVTIASREVVERLVRVEERQAGLGQQLEETRTSLSQRIEDLSATINKRFDDVSKRFDDVNKRFDDIHRRFDDVNGRFTDIMTVLQIIVSALVALVLAIAGAGFVMWRKILAVDAAVHVKVGLDQAIREQVTRLEQEIGFVKGKLKELAEAVEKK